MAKYYSNNSCLNVDVPTPGVGRHRFFYEHYADRRIFYMLDEVVYGYIFDKKRKHPVLTRKRIVDAIIYI